jgi:hypothetical protein
MSLEAITSTEGRLLVDVVLLGPHGAELLHGVATLGPDPAMSAVRAVLHAVNRRLERLGG